MNDQGASDLHLVSGQPPALRIRGDMERVKYKTLEDEIEKVLKRGVTDNASFYRINKEALVSTGRI